jgi:hypothetical protein
MTDTRGRHRIGWLAFVIAALLAAAALVRHPVVVSAADYSSHGAVGSWWGKAIQICPERVAPSACSAAGPALALFMTPTLTADGQFLGNDSFALGAPPLGPHTTAHGQWFPTSPTEFTADYTFMLNAYPPTGTTTISTVRFRWDGLVIDKSTLQGWVNMYFTPPLVPTWTSLVGNEFPAIPNEAAPIITAPTGFVKDPTLCMTAGCPLVFKFTIKRVSP